MWLIISIVSALAIGGAVFLGYALKSNPKRTSFDDINNATRFVCIGTVMIGLAFIVGSLSALSFIIFGS